MHEQVREVGTLTDVELLSRVQAQAAAYHEGNVALIVSLAELDARRLYLGLGYSSLFAYCTQHLRFSEDAAYKRIEAARAARRFPAVLDMLACGELTMSTVAVLARHLTDDNHMTLLQAARNKSKREVQFEMADLDPSPDVPSSIVYLGDGRYRVDVTLPEAAVQDLRRLQDLLRHAVPSADPAVIIGRSLSIHRERTERRHLASRARRGHEPHTRYIPAATRHEVWTRDGAQCAFVGSHGRCQERGFLEIHHVVPFAHGGPTTAANLQLRCRAHNQYEADQAGLSRPAAGDPRTTAATPAAPARP
jgi:5-methylcytosine-specific restriction endonuclease McrA